MGMLTVIVLVVLVVLAGLTALVVALVLSARRSQPTPLPRRSCPQCGQAMPPDAPHGLCPNCLLRGGLASAPATPQPAAVPEPPTLPPRNVHEQSTASGPQRSYHGPFVAPEPAELAPHFPQLEVIEMLGRGGMGAVYKCRQPHLDRLVALKILPPESGEDPTFAERFAREAKTLARLSHPNIVGVHDYGQAGGYYYFLMEYVDGANLRQIIRGGQLKPAEALRIVPQICDALQFAHDEGVVHRDIKPENILVDKRGRVKIADFGLAKLVGPSAVESGLTGTMQVMGTLYYMAPEQMERPKEVDHRADIYSLGVVFYELLTGQLPVGNFPRPSQKVQVDVRLDEVVLRALEHEPQQRYQHASQVKLEVEAISSGSGFTGPRIPYPNQAFVSSPADATLVQRIRAPAVGLIIVGALQCLMLVVGGFSFLFSMGAFSFLFSMVMDVTLHRTGLVVPWPGSGAALVHPLPLFVNLGAPEMVLMLGANFLGIVVLLGGIQMYRLQSYGMVIVAAIFAMLPCGPLFLVGLPIGVWCLIVLAQTEVRQAFGLQGSSRPAVDTTNPATAVQRVRIPAVGLIVVGALQCLLLLGCLLLFLISVPLLRPDGPPTGLLASLPLQQRPPVEALSDTPKWWMLAGGSVLLGNLPGILVLVGGIQMYRLRSYGLAVAASLLAMMPCGPLFILGFPIGLWSLLTLRRPEVAGAFDKPNESSRGLAATSDHYSVGTPPDKAPTQGSVPLEVVRSRLRAPAGGLLITGLITILFALTCILWSGWQLARSMSVPTEPQKSLQGGMTVTITPNKDKLPNQGLVIGLLASQVFALISGILMLLAVLAMRKVEYHRLALLGSSMAMIPISPSWVLGLPVGIWANLVLRRPGVRAVFERPMSLEDETAVDATQQAAWLREWFGTATGWAMMVAFLGAAMTFLPWSRITMFGITSTMAGFDTWHGIVTGCAFVGAFLALVAINYIKPIGLLRALVTSAAGATAIICVWAFLTEMSKGPEVSKPTGTGDPALVNAFADIFKDMFTSSIQVSVLSGPYVTLSFGIALVLLCLWQVGEILVRGRGGRGGSSMPEDSPRRMEEQE